MRTIFLMIATIAVLACMPGCGDKAPGVWPFGWPSGGEPFDSLTREIEFKFLRFAPEDSIRKDVERICAAYSCGEWKAPRDVAGMELRCRYWKARLEMRAGDWESGRRHMEELLEDVDSTSFPYLYKRLEWNLEPQEPEFTVEYYQGLVEDIDFYALHGDIVFQADRCMALSSVLYTFGDYDQALELLDRADSLVVEAGLPEEVDNNIVNRATMLFISGRKDDGEKLLRGFIAGDHADRNDRVLNMAYGNLYTATGDTAALWKAYRGVEGDTLQPDVEGRYSHYLAKEAYKNGDIPAAVYYNDLAYSRMEYIEDATVSVSILSLQGALAALRGEFPIAYRLESQASAIKDSINGENTAEVVNSLETRRLLGEKKLELQLRRKRVEMVWMCVAAVVLLLAVGAVAWMAVRHQRLKAVRANEKLLLEQTNRKVMAMELVLEERESLSRHLDTGMKGLVGKGEMTDFARKTLGASLRPYVGAEGERESFIDLFSQLHPDFAMKVKTRWPALTDAEIRLAAFIFLGLDNRHIGRILSIRPESVRQARWRLRSKLGVKGEDSIAGVLAQLMDL